MGFLGAVSLVAKFHAFDHKRDLPQSGRMKLGRECSNTKDEITICRNIRYTSQN